MNFTKLKKTPKFLSCIPSMLIPTSCFSDISIRLCFRIIITQVFSLRKKKTLPTKQFRYYAVLTCNCLVLDSYYLCSVKASALVYIMKQRVNETCRICLSVSKNPSLTAIKISYNYFSSNHLTMFRNKNVCCDQTN